MIFLLRCFSIGLVGTSTGCGTFELTGDKELPYFTAFFVVGLMFFAWSFAWED